MLPGTVFYGVVPAPPPPSPAAIAAAAAASAAPIVADPRIGQLCAKLVSSADDCTTGQPGSVDRMKYTVSACVNQDLAENPPSSTAPPSAPLTAGFIFEGQSFNIVLLYYKKGV